MKKDYTFSLIRFIALLSVICCHVFEQLGANLGKQYLTIIGNYCAVGVQIFLLLSGFLYGSRKKLFEKEGRVEFISRNIKKILLNYYVYLILFALPIYYILDTASITADSLWRVATFSWVIWGINHFWYIPYIIVCYIFTPMIYDVKIAILEKSLLKKPETEEYIDERENFSLRSYLCRLIILLIMLFIFFRAFGSYFSAAWISCYIIGFFLPELMNTKNIKKILWISPLICMISFGMNYIKYYSRYIWQPSISVEDPRFAIIAYYNEWSAVILGLSLFLIFWLIGKKFFGGRESEEVRKFFDLADKYSFDIYIVHMIYIQGVLSLLKLTSNIYVNIIISVFVILGSAFILNMICAGIRALSHKYFFKFSVF